MHSFWSLDAKDRKLYTITRLKYNQHRTLGLKIDARHIEIKEMKSFLRDLNSHLQALIKICEGSRQIILKNRHKTSRKTFISWDDNGIPEVNDIDFSAQRNIIIENDEA